MQCLYSKRSSALNLLSWKTILPPLYITGVNEMQLGVWESAKVHLKNAQVCYLQLVRLCKDDNVVLASMQFNYGMCCYHLKEYEGALSYLNDCYTVREKLPKKDEKKQEILKQRIDCCEKKLVAPPSTSCSK